MQELYFLLRLCETLFLYISKTIFGEFLKNILRKGATTPVIYTQTVNEWTWKNSYGTKKEKTPSPGP